MAISYEKQMRERVKASGECLFTLHATGPHGKGGMSYVGWCDKAMANEIREFACSLINRRMEQGVPNAKD